MKFNKMLKGGWPEIIFMGIINAILMTVNILVYRMITTMSALLLFFIFLSLVIFYAYKKRFEGLGLDLTKKGSNFLFIKTCMPYMLQTAFFAHCSLLIGWILSNLQKWQNLKF